ncbi:hypothetical protein Tco_0011298 [Tanacetum coccineum]
MLIKLIKKNDDSSEDELDMDNDAIGEEELEDISSAIDPKVSPIVLGKPFFELSNMTYDLSLAVVKFTKGSDEITYKMPHKIE